MLTRLRLSGALLLAGTVSCNDLLPPESVQRASFDNSIAHYLIRTTTDLVRAHIPGDMRGDVNLTVNCRNGGTTSITGTITAAPTGVVTRDLVFDLDDCFTVDSVVYDYGTSVRSLRVSGTLRRNADFGLAFIGAEYESNGPLVVNGTLHLVINSRTSLDPVIAESCAFVATDRPASMSGTYCGRAVSYFLED